MKKKMSSFEILENSFGGSFPPTIKLEDPPKVTVKIEEDTFFVQNIIKILSFPTILRPLYRLVLKALTEELKTPEVQVLKRFTDNNLHLVKFFKKILPILPLLVLSIAVSKFVFKKFIQILLKHDEFDVYGYVSPIKKKHIYLNIKKIQEDSVDIYQVISHENIHVLQGHYGELDLDKRHMDSERVDNYCKLYTDAKVKHQRFIKYLFSKNEIEARVHVLVSAFYVSTRQLPLTRKDFLVCLLYSNDILDGLDIRLDIFSMESRLQLCRTNPKNILDLLTEIKKHAAVMSIYSPITISTHVTVDFSVILGAIISSNELFNFISFELPSYYCNVLKLYGSESVSSKLQNEINKERERYLHGNP